MRLQKLIYQGIVWRGLYYASVFALNIVIARMLQASNSGIFNYLINNISFLLLITSLSLESALAYFSSRSEINNSRLTGIAAVMAMASASISVLLLWLIFNEGRVYPQLMLGMFAYGLGVVLTSYFSSLFYSINQVVFPNVVLIVTNALVLIVAFSDFVADGITERGNFFMIAYFSSFLIQGLILLIAWGVRQQGFRALSLPSLPETKRLLNYAFSALLANIIFFLVYRVDYWFVDSFSSHELLGNYIQVSKLGQIFLLLPSIVATAVFTRTAGGRQEQITTVIQIISRWLLLLYLAFVVVIALTGYWLFPAVYGKSFDQMYGPFLLLSPGILSLSTLSLLTAFYAGKNKMSVNIKGSVIALIVIVTGNFIFIPKYGIYAAALVSSIGYICFQLYVLNHFRKEYRSSMLNFFIPKISDWDRVKQFVRQHEDN